MIRLMASISDMYRVTNNYLKKNKKEILVPPSERSLWAQEILHLYNFKVNVSGAFPINGPVLYVANHISYIDIPLIVAQVEDCVFVSKKEVANWPLFGVAAKKGGTVFVDRGSPESRSLVREQIKSHLLEFNKKIVVFPAGTTSVAEEKVWKKGSFEIAAESGVPVVPMRINYSPLRSVAYIDRDFLPFHLLKLGRKTNLSAFLEFHQPIYVDNVIQDLEYCRRWCNQVHSNIDTQTIPTTAPFLTEP